MALTKASRVYWDADEQQVFKDGLESQDTLVVVIEKLVDRIEQLEKEVQHLKINKILLEEDSEFI